MSMPGFNADTSLFPRRARYQARAVWPGLRQAGVVPSRRQWGCAEGLAFCCHASETNDAGHGVLVQCCSDPSGIVCEEPVFF